MTISGNTAENCKYTQHDHNQKKKKVKSKKENQGPSQTPYNSPNGIGGGRLRVNRVSRFPVMTASVVHVLSNFSSGKVMRMVSLMRLKRLVAGMLMTILHCYLRMIKRFLLLTPLLNLD